ncbi:MAG: toxin-antitoxin system protein [Thermoanaerobaculaceae bacterium]
MSPSGSPTAATRLLRELARREGASLQETVEHALEAYRRALLIEETNRAYAALRSSPEAWAGVMEERRAWDAVLADGQEDDR